MTKLNNNTWLTSYNEQGTQGTIGPLSMSNQFSVYNSIKCTINISKNMPSVSPTITATTPTFSPSVSPTITPSYAPSIAPVKMPSISPTNIPTYKTSTPTFMPTLAPSLSASYPSIRIVFDTTTATEILVTDVNTAENSNYNTFDKGSQNIKSEFEQKWIWVVIIGIIFVFVLMFFISIICRSRWRSAIIKQNSIHESQRRSRETSMEGSNIKINTNSNINNVENIRKKTDSVMMRWLIKLKLR